MKYHTSIDTLPIFNFMKCKEGELQYLYKCDIDNVPKSFPEHFKDVFFSLIYQFDYLDTNFARTLNRIALYENKYYQTLEKKWLNKKNLLIAEHNLMMSKMVDDQPFLEMVAIIEKWLGIQLDIHKTSTRKYYAYIEALKKEHGKVKDIGHNRQSVNI